MYAKPRASTRYVSHTYTNLSLEYGAMKRRARKPRSLPGLDLIKTVNAYLSELSTAAKAIGLIVLTATGIAAAFGFSTVATQCSSPTPEPLQTFGLAGQREVQDLPNGVKAAVGYYSPSDELQHVVTADNDDAVIERWFFGFGRAESERVLWKPESGRRITRLAAYAASGGLPEHVIVALDDDTIHDLAFPAADFSVRSRILAHVEQTVKLAAYYAPSDGLHHVLVATSKGDVHLISFAADGDVDDRVVAHVADITGLAAYYAGNDGQQHVIVVTVDGELREMAFATIDDVQEPVTIGHFDGISRIAAYYSEGDGSQRIVTIRDNGDVYQIRITAKGEAAAPGLLAHRSGILAVSGYYARSDGLEHTVIATNDRKLFEVWFPGSN